MDAKHVRRTAFTLVELLVVIAIIGILVGLLLPAVQSAREAARRAQCTNQVKQIALAVLNYESARQEFPPGGMTYGVWGKSNPDKIPITCASGDCNGTNWAVEILPYLEQQAIYDLYDHDEDNFAVGDPDGDGQINQKVRDYEFPLMKCPSDTYAQQSPGNLAVGSYKAMAGVISRRGSGSGWMNWTSPVGGTSNPSPQGMREVYNRRGLFFSQGQPGMNPEKMKNITDGTSNTIMIGEFHWLDNAPGKAWPAYWAVTQRWHNKAEAFHDPLVRQTDSQFCQQNMKTGPTWSCTRAFGSTHAGDGGNWARIDGSVTFITLSIDGLVYEAVATIAGGETLQLP